MPDARGAAGPQQGRPAQTRHREKGPKDLRPKLATALRQLGPPRAATSEPLVRHAADVRPGIL